MVLATNMITSTLCDDTMTSMPIQKSSNPNEHENVHTIIIEWDNRLSRWDYIFTLGQFDHYMFAYKMQMWNFKNDWMLRFKWK